MRVLLLTDKPEEHERLAPWIMRLDHSLTQATGPPEVLEELEPEEVECVVASIQEPESYDLEGLSELIKRLGWPAVLCLPSIQQGLLDRLMALSFCWVLVEPLHLSQLRASLRITPPCAGRFNEMERALADVEGTLEARRVVERAKGFIMARRGVSETVAHRALQVQSQKENKRLEVLAEEILAQASED